MFNALICTVLILGWARQPDETPALREADYGLCTRKALALTAVLLVRHHDPLHRRHPQPLRQSTDRLGRRQPALRPQRRLAG